MSQPPTVISTFAGCGGSSLGYKLAGFRELLAVEWDKHACACLRANFPGLDVYEGDIGALTVEEVLARTGLKPGELDVFDGSPPCQGFSTFGKRDFGDERNQLFRQFVRLLRGLRPKVFVMENVGGMAKGKMKLIFAEVLRELKASGYSVSARLLNAMYFGVPQSRPRMIFIGVRADLGITPSHPLPTSSPRSVRAAWAGVKNDPAEVAMLLAAGQKYQAYKKYAQISMGRRQCDIEANRTTGYSNRKLHPDKPSRTLCKNDGSITMHGLLHPFERRRPTIAECKRISSFPDDYRFPGEWSDAVARMGNSVPPPVHGRHRQPYPHGHPGPDRGGQVMGLRGPKPTPMLSSSNGEPIAPTGPPRTNPKPPAGPSVPSGWGPTNKKSSAASPKPWPP